jgi:molybdopterin converting factor subunit 1
MAETIEITVRYFAVLREQRGLTVETIATGAATPAALYAELQARHGFKLTPALVRAAVNDAFAPMDRRLAAGDTVVFIPPVAGG